MILYPFTQAAMNEITTTEAVYMHPAKGLTGWRLYNQTSVPIKIKDHTGALLGYVEPWTIATRALKRATDYLIIDTFPDGQQFPLPFVSVLAIGWEPLSETDVRDGDEAMSLIDYYAPSESFSYVYNGTWTRQRATNGIYHVLPATALTANTPVAIWTPAAGKTFRLLGAWLSVAGGLAAATTCYLTDGTAQCTETVQIPTGGVDQRGWLMPSGGLASTTAGNALQIVSPGTPTVSVLAVGMED